ncbi:MAG: hypothetical protein V1794_14850 [Candidatus Glassbacteria bacterium]
MAGYKKYLSLITVLVYSLLGSIGSMRPVVCIEIDGKVRLEESSLPGTCCASLLAGSLNGIDSYSYTAADESTGACGECLDILLFQASQHHNKYNRFRPLNGVVLPVPPLNAVIAAEFPVQAVTEFYNRDFNFTPQNLSIIKTTRLLI